MQRFVHPASCMLGLAAWFVPSTSQALGADDALDLQLEGPQYEMVRHAQPEEEEEDPETQPPGLEPPLFNGRGFGQIAGRGRLHLDLDAFAWRRWTNWNGDGLATNNVDSISILGGPPMLGRPGGLSPIGAPASNLGVGFGWGVNENVLVGLRAGLGWQRLSNPDNDDTVNAFSYLVQPYVSYVFMPDQMLRPFIMARIGFGGSVFSDREDDVTTTVSTIGPVFGIGPGVHWFLGERISLDGSLMFDYGLTFRRTRVANDETTTSDWQRNSQNFNLAVTFGASIWL